MSYLKKFLVDGEFTDGATEMVSFESNNEPPKNHIWVKPEGMFYYNGTEWVSLETNQEPVSELDQMTSEPNQ